VRNGCLNVFSWYFAYAACSAGKSGWLLIGVVLEVTGIGHWGHLFVAGFALEMRSLLHLQTHKAAGEAHQFGLQTSHSLNQEAIGISSG